MLNVDLKQFWKDDELAHLDNCFNTMASQAALGIRMCEECVFEELGVPKLFNTKLSIEERLELNKRYNDKAERIVGKRLLPEVKPGSEYNFPKIRLIGEVFEGSYVTNDYSEWLMPSCSTPYELEKMLDRVEKLDSDSRCLSPTPDHSTEDEVRMLDTSATQGISEKNGPPCVPDPQNGQ